VHDVSFAIQSGEFVTIRGASGSGKSSILNILGCLDTPTAGTYHLRGEDVSRYSDRERSRVRNARIGFVFQSFNLLPRTTALENVEMPMVYSAGRIDRGKAMAALERVGLGHRADHFATELSGGEQQRVALARALVNHPALILADEPTGNLDTKNSSIVLNMLRQSNQELGQTVLMITHNPDAAAIGDRIIHMRDGEIVD
jgi:putative ABC transport system ATP-binding protein